MNTLNLMHHPPRSKKAVIIGGPLARAIYGAGGLAERLRAARAHNKAAFQGRSAVNDDGTRTYKLVELPRSTSRCGFCGRWTVGDDGECRFCSIYEVCPECHCAVGSDAQTTVDDLTVTCHCDCHHYDDEEVYIGVRTAISDAGESEEIWQVRHCEELLTAQTPFFTYHPATGPERYRWGLGGEELSFESLVLAIDIFASVLGDPLLTGVCPNTLAHFAKNVIGNLPDFWVLTREEVLALIDAIQSGEVSHG